MSNLYSLTYISRSTLTGDNESFKEQIASILETARSNNKNEGLTGALMYSGGYFCQALEGPENTINKLFDKIKNDPRHTEVTMLSYQPVEQRSFTDWSMAFAGVQKELPFDINGVKTSTTDLDLKDTAQQLIAVLENVLSEMQSAD